MDSLIRIFELWEDIRHKEFYELKELDMQDLKDLITNWYLLQEAINKKKESK